MAQAKNDYFIDWCTNNQSPHKSDYMPYSLYILQLQEITNQVPKKKKKLLVCFLNLAAQQYGGRYKRMPSHS